MPVGKVSQRLTSLKSLNFKKLNLYSNSNMKLNIFFASATSFILGSLLAASSASADVFVESKTSASLASDSPDSVQSLVNVGYQGFGSGLAYEASIGAGVEGGSTSANQAVAALEGRVYKYITNDITLEGEAELNYYGGTEEVVFTPQVRIRKFF